MTGGNDHTGATASTNPTEGPASSNAVERTQKHSRTSNGAPKANQKHRRNNHNSSIPPSSTVVLKNLDFHLEPIELEDVLRGLSGGRLGYKNFQFQNDANGQFRGMAFVHFHSVEEAKKAISELKPVVLNGRKIYAEYRRPSRQEIARKEYEAKRGITSNHKNFDHRSRSTFEKTIEDTERVLDEYGREMDKRALFFKRYTEERAESKFSMNGKHGFKAAVPQTPETVEFENKYRELLTAYRDEVIPEGEEIPDFEFKERLDGYQRLLIHQLCDQIGLAHISRNYKEPVESAEKEKAVEAERSAEEVPGEENEHKADSSKPVKTRTVRKIIVSKDPAKRSEFKKESILLRKAEKEAAKQKRKELADKAKQSRGPLTEQEQKSIKWFKPRAQQISEGKEHAVNEIQKPSYKIYIPPHQPKGPDGTTGFRERKEHYGISDDSDEVNSAGEGSDTSERSLEDKPKPNEEVQGAEKKSLSSKEKGNGSGLSERKKKAKKLNPLVRPFIPASMTAQD